MNLLSKKAVKLGSAIIVSAVVGVLIRTLLVNYGRQDESKSKCSFGNKKSAIRPVAAIKCRGFTKEELSEYDGVQRPGIYVSVKGVVYEVAPQLYGPGQPYHEYAGHEISRCLAKSDMTMKEANKDRMSGCSEEEMEVLEWWVKKFEVKYPVMGWFVADESFYSSANPGIQQHAVLEVDGR